MVTTQKSNMLFITVRCCHRRRLQIARLAQSFGSQHLPKMQVSSSDSDDDALVAIGKFARPVGNSVFLFRDPTKRVDVRLARLRSNVHVSMHLPCSRLLMANAQAFLLLTYLTLPRASPELSDSSCSKRHPVVIHLGSPERSEKVPPCDSRKVGSQTKHCQTQHKTSANPRHSTDLEASSERGEEKKTSKPSRKSTAKRRVHNAKKCLRPVVGQRCTHLAS